MKTLLRYLLINLASLWIATKLIPGLTYSNDLQTLFTGAIAFAIINIILVPLIKVLLLPLNLFTLGLFAWLTNVLALYALTIWVPGFRLLPYLFPGWHSNFFTLPPLELSTFWVAVLASLSIGIVTHILQWLAH